MKTKPKPWRRSASYARDLCPQRNATGAQAVGLGMDDPKIFTAQDVSILVMHVTRSLVTCDDIGDVGDKLMDLWESCGLGDLPGAEFGEFDAGAIDAMIGGHDSPALLAKVRAHRDQS